MNNRSPIEILQTKSWIRCGSIAPDSRKGLALICLRLLARQNFQATLNGCLTLLLQCLFSLVLLQYL